MNELVIAAWVSCGGFAAFIAREKNREPFGWFILGAIFGIIALISIAGAPSMEREAEDETAEETQSGSGGE